jgi:hypothetical protein
MLSSAANMLCLVLVRHPPASCSEVPFCLLLSVSRSCWRLRTACRSRIAASTSALQARQQHEHGIL